MPQLKPEFLQFLVLWNYLCPGEVLPCNHMFLNAPFYHMIDEKEYQQLLDVMDKLRSELEN